MLDCLVIVIGNLAVLGGNSFHHLLLVANIFHDRTLFFPVLVVSVHVERIVVGLLATYNLLQLV